MRCGSACPIIVDRTVITISASIAPLKTAERGYRIYMIAAMKNVLSPISVAKIIPREFTKAATSLESSSTRKISLRYAKKSTIAKEFTKRVNSVRSSRLS